MVVGVDITLAQESLHGTGNNNNIIIDGIDIDDTNTGINLLNQKSVVDSIIHQCVLLLPSEPQKIDLPPPLLESKLNSDPKNDDSSNVVHDEGQQQNLSFLFRHGKGGKSGRYNGYVSKGGKGNTSYYGGGKESDYWTSGSRSSDSYDYDTWYPSSSYDDWNGEFYGSKGGKGNKAYYAGGKGSYYWTSNSRSSNRYD